MFKSMFKEFKEFISKGNVIDLAIGIMIGGAFQKIVTSIVEDIIMPIIGMITNKVSLNDLSVTIGSATLTYGKFLSNVINFLIISIILFIIVKSLNKAKSATEKALENNKFVKNKKSKKEEPTEKECPYCLSQIPFKATKCKFCGSEQEK